MRERLLLITRESYVREFPLENIRPLGGLRRMDYMTGVRLAGCSD
jgi:hypothetical protein